MAFFQRHARLLVSLFFIFLTTAGIEWWMGRSLLGPDGKFGLWEGSIWSSENSQRFADPYSFSHFVHGILFYAFLWLGARKIPVRPRLLIAVLLEAAWELLENSPLIINRYRAVTVSLGYEGDSVLNSLSDILMMMLGFLFAWRMRPWLAVATVVVMEVGCAMVIRDNLTLNIIILVHPFDAIREWQLAAQPPP